MFSPACSLSASVPTVIGGRQSGSIPLAMALLRESCAVSTQSGCENVQKSVNTGVTISPTRFILPSDAIAYIHSSSKTSS